MTALQTADGAAGSGEERWMTQEEWERRFLNGTSESTYRQLYAITLTELQQVGALAGDELGRYLYDAGWESGKAVGQAEKRLQQEMESLFKPRGSNQQMNRQLKSLERTEAELRKQADAISGYNALKRQLEQLDEQLAGLDERLPGQLEHVRLLAKANAVRPQWLERLELTVEREGVAAAERITGEAEHRWLELERERSGRQAELERYGRELELIEHQRDDLQVDESLLARMDEADALMLESEKMTLLKEERIELASELRGDEEAIGRLIARIAPDWTEEELRALKLTVADREHVRGVKQRDMERARHQERLQADLGHALETERDAAHSLAEAEVMLAGAEPEGQAGGVSGYLFAPQTSEALLAAWND
ncbi:AAA family ATPase, partial [Paenibacillus gorillae]|uniref:AAA family ATPase n=1 Tax=Paenibacillus gorillae TaxID=1243662 RepID=UPI0005A6D343